MKKLLIISCALLISLGGMAQSTDDIALIQSMWGKEKRAIVTEYMAVSSQEEAAFWAEYEAYEVARKEIGKERIAILTEYANNFGSITDAKATELINRGTANNIAIQKLFQKTFKKLSKVVAPIKAAKFLQLENYFLVATQMEIQSSIPFLGELDDLIIEK